MAKTEFLQIRMTPESRRRLSRVAEADHLDESTWARRSILQALDRWEDEELRSRRTNEEAPSTRAKVRKVAERKPPSTTSPRDEHAPSRQAPGKRGPEAKPKRTTKRKRSD